MNVTVANYSDHIAALSLQGRFDAFSVPVLRERVDQLLSHGAVKFVVDLSAVNFMDSAGIGVLVSLLRRARLAGGNVGLVWPTTTAAQRILRLTKFDSIFEMSESADSAVRKFAAPC